MLYTVDLLLLTSFVIANIIDILQNKLP